MCSLHEEYGTQLSHTKYVFKVIKNNYIFGEPYSPFLISLRITYNINRSQFSPGTDDDLEFYVRKCGDILGVTGNLDTDKREAKHILEHVFFQVVEFKKLNEVSQASPFYLPMYLVPKWLIWTETNFLSLCSQGAWYWHNRITVQHFLKSDEDFFFKPCVYTYSY